MTFPTNVPNLRPTKQVKVVGNASAPGISGIAPVARSTAALLTAVWVSEKLGLGTPDLDGLLEQLISGPHGEQEPTSMNEIYAQAAAVIRESQQEE